MKYIDTQIIQEWLRQVQHVVLDCEDAEVRTIAVDVWDGEQIERLMLNVSEVRRRMDSALTVVVDEITDEDNIGRGLPGVMEHGAATTTGAVS